MGAEKAGGGKLPRREDFAREAWEFLWLRRMGPADATRSGQTGRNGARGQAAADVCHAGRLAAFQVGRSSDGGGVLLPGDTLACLAAVFHEALDDTWGASAVRDVPGFKPGERRRRSPAGRRDGQWAPACLPWWQGRGSGSWFSAPGTRQREKSFRFRWRGGGEKDGSAGGLAACAGRICWPHCGS